MAYKDVILADGPIAYYRLGEASGTTATDLSGSSFNGTYGTGVTLGVAGALRGDPDTAITTDGTSNGVVTLPVGVALANNSAVTIEFLRKMTTPAGGECAFTIGNLDNPNRCSANVPWSDGVLYWDYGTTVGNAGRVSTSIASYSGAGWFYVALTAVGGSGGSGQNINVNGVQLATAANSSNPGALTSGDIGFASVYITGNTLTGSIDEFAVYNKVLTPAQIAAHYAASIAFSGFQPGRMPLGV